jgi:hypothetical protein
MPPIQPSLGTTQTQTGLAVAVSAADGRDCAGEVVRGWGEGFESLFARPEAPLLALGRSMTVRLFSSDLRPRAVRVTPVARHDSAGYRRYTFRFDAPEEVRHRFLRFLNQRRAFRVDADPDRPINVRLRVDPTVGDVATAALLRSISSTGLGLATSARVEATLAQVDAVHLAFALPPGMLPLAIVAAIRSRRLDADGSIFYGLEFDPARTADYELQERAILDYVMLRQREDLQRKLR